MTGSDLSPGNDGRQDVGVLPAAGMEGYFPPEDLRRPVPWIVMEKRPHPREQIFHACTLYRASALSPSTTFESDSTSPMITVTAVPPSGRIVTLTAPVFILLTQPVTFISSYPMTAVPSANISTTAIDTIDIFFIAYPPRYFIFA